jgi:hypothetical protein
LTAEVADVARRKRFLAAGLQTALNLGPNGNGSTRSGDSGPASAELKLPARVHNLPELATRRPDQDHRWKPPGGVAARFRLSKPSQAVERAGSSHAVAENITEPAPQPHEEGGNGTVQSALPADSNADAITIELKSS